LTEKEGKKTNTQTSKKKIYSNWENGGLEEKAQLLAPMRTL
jgi:hypothetical protein